MGEEILCQLAERSGGGAENLPGLQEEVSNGVSCDTTDFRLRVFSAERVCGSQVHTGDFIRDANSHSNCSCLGCVLGRSTKRLYHSLSSGLLRRLSTRAKRRLVRLPILSPRTTLEIRKLERELNRWDRTYRRFLGLGVSLVFLSCLISYSTSAFAVIMGSEQGVKQSANTATNNAGAIWPKDPRTVIVDGNVYPYTAAGLQAAINLASTNATGGNSADVFVLPHANFALGSTGITVPTNVCLVALGDPNSEAITYNGTGAAVTFDATAGNLVHSCLQGFSIFLGPSAGPSAVALLIKSTFGTGQANANQFSHLILSNNAVSSGNQNQVGILMWDTTGAPAGVSSNLFSDILFGNINEAVIGNTANATCTASVTPFLCCTGVGTGTCGSTGEANEWNAIRLTGQNWQNQFQMNDADSFFQIWSSAQPQNCSVGSPCITFSEAGRMNQIFLKADNGSTTSFKSINDTGNYNIWNLSALTPVGTIAATSHISSIPSATIGVAGAVEQEGVALNNLSGFNLNSKLLFTATAPTISSGFGTTPTIASQNGTASFQINVGTGGTATSGVIGLPAAPTGWSCFCTDLTTTSTTVFVTKMTANATNSCTVGNFSDVAAAAAWVASDKLWCSAVPN